jgi:L-fuculose-phosphate aldolase
MLLASERALVVRYAQSLRSDGLVVGTAGNLSVRAGDAVAITPSGLDYDDLTPEAVCVVALDGTHVECRLEPSRELVLHLAAYRATEAAAVVHSHPPFATAVAAVAAELPPIHYLIADLGGAVRVAAYATPGSEELAELAAQALEGRTAALLASHGAITVGSSLQQAYGRSLLLEWLAGVYLHARALGEPRLLTEDELERLAEAIRSYGAASRTG